MKLIYRLPIIITATICLFLQTLQSQTRPPNGSGPASTITLPYLAGHKFIPSNLLKMPFTSTNIRNTLGYGQTVGLEIPLPDIDGEEVPGIPGDLFFATLEFYYMQQIKSWLGVWFRLNVLGRMSADTPTLISEGINTSISSEFGWMFKLWQNESMMLSGSASLSNNSYTIINLINFIGNVIENGGITSENKLVQSVPAVRGGAGIHYAWAINEMSGINMMLEIEYGESPVRTNNDDWSSTFGASVDYDLKPRLDVPIGFVLTYWQSASTFLTLQKSSVPRSVSVMIAYTAEDKFSLSLHSGFLWYKPDGYENDIDYLSGNLSLRFYF